MKKILSLLMFGLVFIQLGYSQKNIRNFPVKEANPNDSIPIIYNGKEYIIQPKTLPTWGNSDDTITANRKIYQGDKSFSIKGNNFGFHLNAKLSELDSVMNEIIQEGIEGGDTILISAFSRRNENFKDFNFNGLVENFKEKSTDPIMAKFKDNPFPLEDPYKVGSFNILSVTNDIETIPGDTLIYTQIQSIYKDIPNGKFYLSGIEAIGGRISIYSSNFITNNDLRISFENDQISLKALNHGHLTSELVINNGGILIKGAVSFISTEIFEDGGDDTISSNIRTYIYNPDSLQNNITIYLPDNPVDGQYLTIVGGGTIQNGNVATNISLRDHNGNTPIGWSANDLQAGPGGTFVWVESANRWYQVSY